MAACPDWSQPESVNKLPSVAAGNASVLRFLKKRAASLILNRGNLKTWHYQLFQSVVPLSYYAGNFRCHDPSRPCLAQPVQVGAYMGSDYHVVENEMQTYSANLQSYTQQTDSHIKIQPSFVKRVQASLEMASWAVGRFVQIHPFLNGNGRISRLLANYFFLRYDLGIVPFNTISRPGGDYEQSMTVCMAGDFRPLFRYFVLSLAGTKP